MITRKWSDGYDGTPPMSSIATPYRSLRKVTAPVVWPVTLTDVKSHCRVDIQDDDTYLMGLIAAASTWAEEQTDQTLVTTTLEAAYDDFPLWEIILPRPPAQAQNEIGRAHV